MQAPSDHLLRTMAAVPITSYILDLGCGEGRHTEPLLRLGFPVHGCDPRPGAVQTARERVTSIVGEEGAQTCVQVVSLDEMEYPDEAFDWVIAYHAEVLAETPGELHALLSRTRRMLKPGGWTYVSVPASEADIEEQERTSGDGAPASAPVDTEATSSPFTIDVLTEQQRRANLAMASAPEVVKEHGAFRTRAIFRRVEPQTPA